MRRRCLFVFRWVNAIFTFPPLAIVLAASAAQAIPLRTERVASGLNRPVFATSPPGDAERLFVLEQHTGRIRIVDLASGTVLSDPFLDIDGLATGNEQGLLGLAFHPDYAANGRFFVNLTVSGGDTQIREYRVSADDPNRADPLSGRAILRYDQPFSNHNGGWIAFNPPVDGRPQYLYVSSGDGGSARDPQNNAQTLNSPLGKILRIDVDRPDRGGYGVPPDNPFFSPGDGNTSDDLVWAYGLRNPWRASFDRQTGDLWIGDVGQSTREEIDFEPGTSAGGENFGWRVKEGTLTTGLGGGTGPFVDPVYEYDNSSQGVAVTGGYVYRGSRIPGLEGTYLFGDFAGPGYSGAKIWSFRYDGTEVTEFADRTDELAPEVGTLTQLASLAEDARGELYALDLGGDLFRILADVLLGDMDGNGLVDFDDIGPLVLGLTDPDAYQASFGVPASLRGDLDEDGDFDFDDIGPLVERLNGGPGGEAEAARLPEPSSSGLIWAVGLWLLGRRPARTVPGRVGKGHG